MSDPVVHITNGIPDGGTGNITTLGQTLTDGANVTVGAIADAAVAAGAVGTLSAKLRAISRDIANIVLAAGSNVIGAVTQSGTWTVQPGNTANTTAWKVDGSAVTQPVSNTPLTNALAGEYETVAASATTQVLGATGAAGDFLSGLLVIPATTSPGLVTVLDNATSIPVFVGGATSVSNLIPFFIPLGMYSVSGAWKVTTGLNVSVIGIGNFT